MKALILVGGYGTRLRPLTLSVPKPVVPFANKPMVVHQLEALKRVGVTSVVLAVSYKPEMMMEMLEPYVKDLGISITYSKEDEPLGTAGPLALARDKLKDDSDSPIFVLNSDVTCEYPLQQMLDQHRNKAAEATLCTIPVDDPSRYGVVVMDDSMRVREFVEKPKSYVGNKINAGIYLLQPSVLDRIPQKPTSIEKETFPAVANDGKMFGFVMEGYWMDIGQPKDFLGGQHLFMQSLKRAESNKLSTAIGKNVEGNALIHESASVSSSALIGPDVSIGRNCQVEDGARLRNCVIMDGCKIGKSACITDSIVGWNSTVGKWARVAETSVLGEDVEVKPEVILIGATILLHKEAKESILSPKIVL